MFTNDAIYQFAHHLVFEPIKAAVHPDKLSSDTIGSFTKDLTLQRGVPLAHMAIATASSRVSLSYFIDPSRPLIVPPDP
jgi:hypothetical protein